MAENMEFRFKCVVVLSTTRTESEIRVIFERDAVPLLEALGRTLLGSEYTNFRYSRELGLVADPRPNTWVACFRLLGLVDSDTKSFDDVHKLSLAGSTLNQLEDECRTVFASNGFVEESGRDTTGR